MESSHVKINQKKGTFSMPTQHTPSHLSVAFDDGHLVTDAGLALGGLLSERLRLEEFCDETIDIAPFPRRRVARLVHALVCRASTTPTYCARVRPRWFSCTG